MDLNGSKVVTNIDVRGDQSAKVHPFPLCSHWSRPAALEPGTAFFSSFARSSSETTLLSGTGASFLFGALGEAAVVSFLIERMRLSLSPHPQNPVIPREKVAIISFHQEFPGRGFLPCKGCFPRRRKQEELKKGRRRI
jgi:hypothetical protein